tara:strand:+ start:7320 stop:7520 length:201 start_codon:yes stop_codon:yes gene_type:complete
MSDKIVISNDVEKKHFLKRIEEVKKTLTKYENALKEYDASQNKNNFPRGYNFFKSSSLNKKRNDND